MAVPVWAVLVVQWVVTPHKRELKRWPQYRKLYVSAFEDMLEARRRDGKLNHSSLWQSGEGVMQWWTGCEVKAHPDQTVMF